MDATQATEVRTQRIVVGVDGSEGARRALRWAAKEAQLRGAVLDVVHTWHIPYVGASPYAAGTIDWSDLEPAARATLDHEITKLGQLAAGLQVTPLLVTGAPAQAITDAAKDADLVVVGSRGHGGFAGLLLGSVSQQVAHHATCPVVIVPEP
jgi:nucleotide-binding universal stress UspA family protein